MQTRAFDTFPREIHERILHNCDYVTIIHFSLTCKQAYNIVSASVALQLHIEMEINGLEIADGSSKGNLNYSLALKELREYQDAWLNFRLGPMFQQPIGTSNADVPNWELRNGTYYGEFRVSEPDHDEDFLVDRTQIAILGSPSIPPPTNYGKKFSFCIADPKQDLAVLVEDEQQGYGPARFHLCSLATGQSHPRAERPVITIAIDDSFLRENDLLDEIMSADPEIMGNYLVVKLDWRESDCNASEILVLDWTLGILLVRVCLEFSSGRYTFLDKEHLLVSSVLPEDDARPVRLALLVYRIPTIFADHGVPVNMEFRPFLYPKHSPILIFEFPELLPAWKFTGYHFMLSSDPLPGDVVYSKSITYLRSRVTTLGLGFRIWDNPRQQPYVYGSRKGTPTDFHVFIDTRYLFVHLAGLHGLQSEDVTPRTIPWNQWGTAATRWFKEDDSIEHLSVAVYGSQYIRSTSTKSGEAQLLSIVDFNSPVIKRHAYASAMESRAKRASADRAEKLAVLEGKGMTGGRLFQTRTGSAKLPIPAAGQALNQEIVTETIGSDMKTIIRMGFKEPVVSCLPYRTTTRVQRMPLHGHWRIHGEYLVGIVSLAYQSKACLQCNLAPFEQPRIDWSIMEMSSYLSLCKLELRSQE